MNVQVAARGEVGGARVEEVGAAGVVELGEGPHWVDSEQALYWVDLLAGALHRLHPASGLHAVTKPPGGRSLSFVVPVRRRPGLFVVGHGSDISLLRWDGKSPTSSIEYVLGSSPSPPSPNNVRFNDGKADPTGRLWAGTMSTAIDRGEQQPVQGCLFSIEKNGMQLRLENLSISNGLAWHDDVMYFIDSTAERIDAFDLEPASGKITNRRCVYDFKTNAVEGVPDGMTVDAVGNLWIACFGGSQVICVDPRSGRFLRRVKIPALQVTSVCWGGRLLDQLYVTTAAVQGQKGINGAGRLFRVSGLEANGLLNDQVLLHTQLENLANC